MRYRTLNGTFPSAQSRQPPGSPPSESRCSIPATRITGNQVDVLLGPWLPKSATHPSYGPTRLDSTALAIAPPRADRGPFSCSHLVVHARLPLREVPRLGQDVCQLGRSRSVDELRLAIPNHLVREMLPRVHALREHRLRRCSPSRMTARPAFRAGTTRQHPCHSQMDNSEMFRFRARRGRGLSRSSSESDSESAGLPHHA